MYSCIVSPPTRSPTSAQTVLTELVSAWVSGIDPKSWLPELFSGAPEIVLGDRPSTCESFVYLPLSIAATAVTTLNVDPGGYWPSVVRLSADPFSSASSERCSRSSFGSNDGTLAIDRKSVV